MSIRKGDEKGLKPKNIKEIRDGAGNLIWSPSSLIDSPTSVTNRWKMNDNSSSSYLNDSEGSVDMNTYGGSYYDDGKKVVYEFKSDNNDFVYDEGAQVFMDDTFSLLGWFYPHSKSMTSSSGFAGSRNYNHDNGSVYWTIGIGDWIVDNGKFHVSANNVYNSGNQVIKTSAVTDNRWQFFALTGKYNDDISLYFADVGDSDVTHVGSKTFNDNSSLSAADHGFLGKGYSGHFDGYLSDFQYFGGTAISYSKINDIFKSSKSYYT